MHVRYTHEQEEYFCCLAQDDLDAAVNNVLDLALELRLRSPERAPRERREGAHSRTGDDLGYCMVSELDAAPDAETRDAKQSEAFGPLAGYGLCHEREQRPQIEKVEAQRGAVRARHAVRPFRAHGARLGDVVRRRTRLADHVLDRAG